jgi:hypothetical protein
MAIAYLLIETLSHRGRGHEDRQAARRFGPVSIGLFKSASRSHQPIITAGRAADGPRRRFSASDGIVPPGGRSIPTGHTPGPTAKLTGARSDSEGDGSCDTVCKRRRAWCLDSAVSAQSSRNSRSSATAEQLDGLARLNQVRRDRHGSRRRRPLGSRSWLENTPVSRNKVVVFVTDRQLDRRWSV